MAARRRELDGVGEKIPQNLSYPLGIGAGHDTRVSGNPIERESFLREKRLNQLDRALQRLAGFDVEQRVRHTPAPDSREGEDLGDEQREVLLIRLYAREIGVLLLGDGSAQSHVEELDVAGDGIEWRAHVVAHRAEERCLRFVGSLGAPLEHQREVVYLRTIERQRSSRCQVFSKLHVLWGVPPTSLSADESDRAQQPGRSEEHTSELQSPD